MKVILWGSILSALVTLSEGRELDFRLTIQVVDEVGQPVPDANTGISFERGRARNESERFSSVNARTDQDGRAMFSGATAATSIALGAEKEGFYRANGIIHRFTGYGAFRWQPWNTTIKVVLKRIRNPVPMYAKRVNRGVPELNQPCAFDLELGDWLPPHGKGKTPDFIFVATLDSRGEDDFDFELRLMFSNPADGIQRFQPDPPSVMFRSPYEAPADGYLSAWTLKRWRHGRHVPIGKTFDFDGGYFFRVRTELDEQGDVSKASYGKIYGDFFSFVYWLNPDGTRNMECDPKRNLLRAPTPRERHYYEIGP